MEAVNERDCDLGYDAISRNIGVARVMMIQVHSASGKTIMSTANNIREINQALADKLCEEAKANPEAYPLAA